MSTHRLRPSPLVSLPRGALVIALVLWAATFALGFAAKAASGWLTSQLVVDRALNDAHSSLFDAVARALDHLDSVSVVAVCLVILAVLVGLFVSWGRALAAVVIAGGGWVLCLIPKAVVGETRPPLDAVAHLLHVSPATLSYPSGHTVFAVTLSAAVLMVCRGLWARIIVLVVGILFVAVTAWSRLYVGAHYPTDVLGALLAGAGGALLVAWLWNFVVRRILARRSPSDTAPAADAARG
ncbi:phosphatase PAP2 family protein [Planctomonas sp. JC2975]|uniref:phosphatase PAP2 family protein n=1 Tax=Planctomonas sp. JC2975 TaxID=2729626 RepID=UPI0014762861|nr:phosphatase PAP2 family protein [Planctomonas sp. JC2975]NNC13713.1 phosphatase PAP2 family protein [Planctomonas sp. JC2975]